MDATLILIDGDAELARARSLIGQEGAEHGDGAKATRPLSYFSRSAPSSPEEGAGPAHEQASRRLMRGNDGEEPAEGHQRALGVA